MSKLKQMGIKSLHYSGNRILFQNSFSKDISLLYKVDYDDIDKLLKAKDKEPEKLEDSPVEFKDIKNKRGFKLSRGVNKRYLTSTVKRVKTVSFVQKLFGITDSNNFEIQIFNNYKDIKRIILNYLSHVIYSISSYIAQNSYNLDSSDKQKIQENFDIVGYLILPHIEFDNFLLNGNFGRKYTREEFIKKVLPWVEKLLNKYGVSNKKTQTNTTNCNVEIVKYLVQLSNEYNRINYYKNINDNQNNQNENINYQNSKISLTENQKRIIRKNYYRYRNEFENLLNQQVDSLCSGLSSDRLKDFNFDELVKKSLKKARKSIEKENLKQLNKSIEKKEIIKNIKYKSDDFFGYKTSYDYLRVLSALRNWAVHGENFNFDTTLFELAKSEVNSFVDSFAKNNQKYLAILKEYFKREEIFDKFFEYVIYDDKKNLGISITKIRKIVCENLDIKNGVDLKILSEFLNKFNTILQFLIYIHYSEKGDLLQEIINKLKQCENEAEKEEVYNNLAVDFINKNSQKLQNLKKITLKYHGKFDFDEICYNFKLNTKIDNNFYNCLYLFSKFLTTKEANDLYAQIINKVDAIIDLNELAKIANVQINSNSNSEFKGFKLTFVDLDESKRHLELLRSIRLKNSVKKEDIKNDGFAYKRIRNCFDSTGYSDEDFETDLSKSKSEHKNSVKPLKQFLRNNVFVSKQFQYLSCYVDTSICQAIVKNREIVRFAIFNMLGSLSNKFQNINASNFDKKYISMLKYLSKIYHQFHYQETNEFQKGFYISSAEIEELVDEVCNLSFRDIKNSIFKIESTKNYTVLVSLYLNVCYLVVKNLMKQNSAYMVQMQDYDMLYKKVKDKEKDVTYNLDILNAQLKFVKNKNSRSYIQQISLLNKDYIKHVVTLVVSRDQTRPSYNVYKYTFEKSKNNKEITNNTIKEMYCNENYKRLLRKYRNTVDHCSILNDKNLFAGVKNVTSYFALYQILLQKCLKLEIEKVWDDKTGEFFKLDKNKSYSTKLCIALNLPFAYDISRFNNNTIEKYNIKNKSH